MIASEEMDDVEKNIYRAGHFFICTIWVQSQMASLIILNRNPKLIDAFNKDPKELPDTIAAQRMEWTKKSLGNVMGEFEKDFAKHINDQFDKDLKTVLHLRNAIAHSHVSLGRSFMLYRPDSDTRLAKIEAEMKVIRRDGELANPPVLKLDFSNDKIYSHNFEAIKRLDEQHLRSIADCIGVPHRHVR